MEKYPLKGNSKSIALNSFVGGSNKNIIGNIGGSSGNNGTDVTYQSVSKKVIFPSKLSHHFLILCEARLCV